ncbi:ACT domain-containing protein [Rhizobium sp. ARZ01]|uniref:ACT domain-containing protein n=1 Tax=Rhizobium sp. ARZ01 TaxID=2769313 RepID=UPI0017876B94|nr:ACT domain-containing protein [Rhizobium sp. ARZ01]MBD9372989.1 ACT domain-containing protein [Rhizobium sp. ARZ01]
MSGITEIDRLLAEMQPELREGTFVYCVVPFAEAERCYCLQPLATFREEEGLSLILPQSVADATGLAASAPMRMITLTVHSSLEAVGLTAAIATALTREGISANVVAAFHHDHVFIPADDAERALAALKALSRNRPQR